MAHDDHDEHSELGEMDVRVRALQTVLAQKGYVDPAALDVLIDTYQTKIGPRNGARVVARAWVDSAFRAWLLDDASAAIEPGSSAAILIFENVWATTFVQALRNSDAQLVAAGYIPLAAIAESLDATE